ncbi:MAG: PorV/PorQ family protein [Bacteroidia bacterium]|nr:PorV/PorQ family protein [Bacteroidia bacterium]
MKHALLIFFTIGLLNAQPVRKYSNEFLNIGVGAKNLGMGNTGIAGTEGVYSGYWNPAGLLQQKNDFELGLMHSEYFAGIAKYDFLGGSKKIDSASVLGISFIRFGVDNIPNTLDMVDASGNVNYDKIKQFSVTDFAAIVSYARHLNFIKGIMAGANMKIIRRRIGDFGGAWGFGTDVGLKYPYKKWMFGLMGKDITGTFNAWNYSLTEKEKAIFFQTGNEIPQNSIEITMPRLVFGASYSEKVWKEKIELTGEVNLINTFDGKRNTVIKTSVWSMEPAFGFEANYKRTFFLRFGFGNIQRQFDASGKRQITTMQPNAGVGLKYRGITLDYAMTDIGDRSIAIYSHMFSLRLEMNRKK